MIRPIVGESSGRDYIGRTDGCHEKGNVRCRVRIGVSSGIEDSEVRVSNLEPIVRSYGQFSAPVKRGSSK